MSVRHLAFRDFVTALMLSVISPSSCLLLGNAEASIPQTTSPTNEVRFPVAHAHTGSWCMGYLYISADSIRYEVVRPDKDKKHSFQIARSELTAVQQWVLMGTPQNAAEIKNAHAVYHFWWMPSEDDLQPGQPSHFNPHNAALPDTLIAALRDPSTVLGGNTAAPEPSVTAQAPPAIASSFSAAGQSQAIPDNATTSPVNASPSAPAPSSFESNDTWKPDTQIGDFQFNMPPGWSRVEAPPGPRLVPNDLPQGGIAYISFLPAQVLTSDLRSWFNDTWAGWRTQFKVQDAGAIELDHNPNGFDVMRIDARVYHQRLGYSEFVLAAAHIGDRVEPYFFISNTGNYSYRNSLSDFEHSLRFANARAPQASVSPSAVAGNGATSAAARIDGLYVGYKMRGLIGLHSHMDYFVFFRDGNVIRYLPEEGLENFNFAAALRQSRDYCGRYSVDGNQVTLAWADNNTERAARVGATLKIGGDSYFHVSKSDNLTFAGTYRREGADLAQYLITFSADGRFAENGLLSLLAYSGKTSPGRGSYRVRNNTITLSYNDGRRVPLSFFILPPDEGRQQPSAVVINTYYLIRAQ